MKDMKLEKWKVILLQLGLLSCIFYKKVWSYSCMKMKFDIFSWICLSISCILRAFLTLPALAFARLLQDHSRGAFRWRAAAAGVWVPLWGHRPCLATADLVAKLFGSSRKSLVPREATGDGLTMFTTLNIAQDIHRLKQSHFISQDVGYTLW
jgi:hypothetical protein